MATVRLTTDLRYKIKQEAQNIFIKRIENAKIAINSLADSVYNEHFQAIIPQLEKIPAPWLRTGAQLIVSVEYDNNIFNYPLLLNPARPMPLYMTEYTNSSTPPERIIKIVDPVLKAELNTYYGKIQKLILESNAFTAQVTKIVNSCNTLGQFLKIWPQGENLIPEVAMDRHRSKDTVVKRAAPDIEITNELNKSLLTAKLVSS